MYIEGFLDFKLADSLGAGKIKLTDNTSWGEIARADYALLPIVWKKTATTSTIVNTQPDFSAVNPMTATEWDITIPTDGLFEFRLLGVIRKPLAALVANTIAFNPTTAKFEYYNGTDWVVTTYSYVLQHLTDTQRISMPKSRPVLSYAYSKKHELTLAFIKSYKNNTLVGRLQDFLPERTYLDFVNSCIIAAEYAVKAGALTEFYSIIETLKDVT